MATLPTLVKTYQFTVNQTQPATGTQTTTVAKMLFNIVAAMKAFGSNPWTEISSCNSVSTGTGEWTSYASLVWGGGAHSWIVLKQAGANGAEICFDLNSAQTYIMTVVYSPSAGFTGGSTTARPTATDSVTVLSTGAYASASDANYVWHLIQSTDGAITRLFIILSNTIYTYFSLEVPSVLLDMTAWSPLNLCSWISSSTAVNLYTSFYTGTNAYFRINGINTLMYYTSEASQVGVLALLQTYQDDNTGDWPLYPIGLWCNVAPNRGHKGNLIDVWWGASNNLIGTSYPATGTLYQFAQFGSLIIPWNSSTAPLTA